MILFLFLSFFLSFSLFFSSSSSSRPERQRIEKRRPCLVLFCPLLLFPIRPTYRLFFILQHTHTVLGSLSRSKRRRRRRRRISGAYISSSSARLALSRCKSLKNDTPCDTGAGKASQGLASSSSSKVPLFCLFVL